jgi:hypothetical protein
MKNKVKFFDVTFVNPGTAFDAYELSVRIQSFFAGIKVLIPKVDNLLCDLDYKLQLVKWHL